MENTEADVVLVCVPAPNTNEMVNLLASQMDQLFEGLSERFEFSTGDVMSACLCHIVEAGSAGRGGNLEGLQDDIVKSVEIAIAHYGPHERRRQN